MPDYDLGRAHGRVEITADTTGAQRGMQDYERSTRRATEAVSDHARIESELTKRRQEAERALQVRKTEEDNYRKVMKDSNSTLEEQIRAELRRNSAKAEAEASTRRLIQAENAHRASVDGNTDAVRRFITALDGAGSAHDRNTRKMRDWRQEINETDRTLKVLSSTITSTFGTALKVAGGIGAAGAAGGLFGLLGGGGVQGIVAVTEAIKELSGAALLLPSVVGGAATVLGTLAVSLNGVGDALAAVDDPQKFAQAISQLAPAAAQAVTILASFEQAFKGAMQAVQQEFFKPLVDQIQPLVYLWLPALMQAGQQVAAVLGQAGRVISQWLQQPQVMSAFQEFITNLVSSMQQLLPAIQPVADAFLTLTRVGSQFFPQIAQAIVQIANAFNAWVQGAAQSGQLQSWIQTSINAFTQLFQIISNVVQAFGNIGALANTGGGLLGFLAELTKQFKEWTESASGTQLITEFFANMKAAADVLGPILRIVGEAVLQLLNNLALVGTQAGSGMIDFFKSIADALNVLGQALIASGPALGQMLSTIGEALLGIVQEVGPQLPTLFRNLADVMIDLAPAAVQVASAIADFMAQLTPGQIETILGLVVAFQGLSTIIPVVVGVIGGLATVAGALGISMAAAAGVIGIVIAALVALVGGIIYAATHWDEVKQAMSQVWDAMKSFGGWIADTFTNIWRNLSNTVGNVGTEIVNSITGAWNTVTSTVSGWFEDAYDWGRNIVNRLIDGIKSMFHSLSDAWDWLVGGSIDDKNPHSPPKKGPLSGAGDPLVAGRAVTTRFAEGIQQGAPAVSSAYDGAVDGFSSAGISSGSTSAGGGSSIQTGQSGFEQWIKSLTDELSAWSRIGRGVWDIIKGVSDMFITTTKIVASLWNQGDNPLTRPGGIAGPPKAVGQEGVPGVPNAPEIAGKAPMPELTPGYYSKGAGVPSVAQQGVPGVPSAGGTPGAGGSGGQGWWQKSAPKNPPASTTVPPPNAGTGQQTVPLQQRPDGTWTSPNPAWAHLLQRESGGINQRQKRPDSNSGGNEAEGLFQITPATWRANGGQEFAPNPLAASPEDQAKVAARILGSDPGAWGFYRHPGREDPEALRQGLINVGPQGPITPPPAPPPVATNVGGAPQITDRITPNKGGAIKPDVFLVHTEEGPVDPTTGRVITGSGDQNKLAATMERAGDRSYNYLINRDTGAVTRAVPAGEKAWAVGPPGNARSINAVIAGSTVEWTKEQWLQHDAALNSLAFLAARDAQQFGIPIQQLGPGSQSGIGGHDWVSENLGGTDHTDPGPNFPWQEFFGKVRAFAGQSGTPPPVNSTTRTLSESDFGGINLADQQTSTGGASAEGAVVLNTETGNTFTVNPDGSMTPLGRGKDDSLFGDSVGAGAPPANPPANVQGAPRFGLNPASRARIPLGGTTTQAVQRAGLTPLYKPGTTDIPPQIQQFAQSFGLKASTYPGGGSLHQAGFAFDLTGKPEDMDRFADFVQNNLAGQTLELIHSNERTGQRWGIAGGQRVDVPGAQYQNYFTDQYALHGDFGDNAHVHWATDVPPVILTGDGSAVPVVGQSPGGFQPPPGTPLIGGAQSNQITPPDVAWRDGQLHIGSGAALPANIQGTYDPNKPLIGTGAQISPDIYRQLIPGQPSTGTGLGQGPGGGLLPGGGGQQNTQSPLDQFQSAMAGASSIVGDAFQIFDDIITNISAAADITHTLVRGFENTEDVNRTIDNIQTFIKTGADVAKLTSDSLGLAGSIVGAGAGADPSGGASGAAAALQAGSAIAGLISQGLEMTNAGIDLSQEIYHQLAKYGASIAAFTLGNGDTGPLGGNVRMLLNTNTGQVYAYSEDNPDNKAVHNLPGWFARAYGGPNPNAQPNNQVNQLNMYVGPGQNPMQMMQDTMWLVSTGAPSVASVAGAD